MDKNFLDAFKKIVDLIRENCEHSRDAEFRDDMDVMYPIEVLQHFYDKIKK